MEVRELGNIALWVLQVGAAAVPIVTSCPTRSARKRQGFRATARRTVANTASAPNQLTKHLGKRIAPMKQTSIILLLMALLTVTSFADPVALDLQDCVRMAVTRNQAIQSASDTVRANQARITEAEAPLLPNLNLFYNETRALNPLGAPIHASFGTFQSQPFLLSTYKDGVNLTQLLYDGQKTASLVRQQEALTQASRSDYRLTTEQTAFNAISGFYNLAIDREQVRVGEENLKDAEDHLKLANARYKAGVAPRTDVISAQVPLATAELNLTQAQQIANNAEASLARTLALPITTPIVLKGASELSYPVTQEEAFQIAAKNRDEIKRAQSVVNSAKAQLDAAHGGFMPVISAVANYGYTDYGPNVLPGNLGYSYGIQGTFNIFEGNFQSGQVAEAKALLDKNLSDLDAARQDVFLNVRQSFLSFQSAKQSVSQAETALASALENLHATEGEYKAGLIPILNLTDAQASHLQAATNELGARLNYQIAMAQLLLAMGIPLEDLHAISRTP